MSIAQQRRKPRARRSTIAIFHGYEIWGCTSEARLTKAKPYPALLWGMARGTPMNATARLIAMCCLASFPALSSAALATEVPPEVSAESLLRGKEKGPNY